MSGHQLDLFRTRVDVSGSDHKSGTVLAQLGGGDIYQLDTIDVYRRSHIAIVRNDRDHAVISNVDGRKRRQHNWAVIARHRQAIDGQIPFRPNLNLAVTGVDLAIAAHKLNQYTAFDVNIQFAARFARCARR